MSLGEISGLVLSPLHVRCVKTHHSSICTDFKILQGMNGSMKMPETFRNTR